MWYWLNIAFYKALVSRLVDYRVEGRHHEPPPPYLLIANHTSALDDPAIGLAVRVRLVYVGMEELLRPWLLGLYFRSLGSIFIRRGEPDLAALEAVLRALRQGRAVSIMPEGTRSRDGRIAVFHQGTAWLALRAGVAVLPVGIEGAYRAMPRGTSWPRQTTVVARIGPPIYVPKVEGRISRAMREEWTERFRRAVIDLLPPDQQPLPSPPPPVQDPLMAGGVSGGRSRTADG